MDRPTLEELANTANSHRMSDMWLIVIQEETKRDFQIARKLFDVIKDLNDSMEKRQGIINDLKFDKSLRAVESAAFFNAVQEKELALKIKLEIDCKEAQLRTFEKTAFLEKIKKLS